MTITVTRILYATTQQRQQLNTLCRYTQLIRADIWRRFGALGTQNRSVNDIRKIITEAGWYNHYPLDGTIRNETTKDALNDLFTYRAAAFAKISGYSKVQKQNWTSDPKLHRLVRKHFKHGISHNPQQFIVRSDKHITSIVNGLLTIRIKIASKYGDDIILTTSASGKNVDLSKANLRIIVKDDKIEIHYATTKPAGRPIGTAEIGVDKGYSEAFMDSDGQAHGVGFGKTITAYSDQVKTTGQARNKLHALEKKYREAGKHAKADRIKQNNLGRKKLDARRERAQAKLRDVAYKAAHALFDKAEHVISEDLTRGMGSQSQWKNYNRRMSAWAKGVLARAVEDVSLQRGGRHSVVNCAYTSQIDSETGLLEGKRVGDRFYRVTGDVVQADHNAARNVRQRYHDLEISRYMAYREVKRVLLLRIALRDSFLGDPA